MIDFDEGDKGELTADEQLALAKQVTQRLGKDNYELSMRIKLLEAELKSAKFGEETFRKMLENGRKDSLWKRLYVAAFAPEQYGT